MPSSEVPSAFKEAHGLDDDWRVRFTADRTRVQEMAKQYRRLGYEVAVVPLQPAGDRLTVDELEAIGDQLEHDPIDYIEAADCVPCLEETFVVFTRGDPADPEDAEIDAILFE